MSWRYDRTTGHVLDDAGQVIADVLPEHGALVAAAPDLLAAAKKARRFLHHGGQALTDGRCNYAPCALCALRAALSKAGES